MQFHDGRASGGDVAICVDGRSSACKASTTLYGGSMAVLILERVKRDTLLKRLRGGDLVRFVVALVVRSSLVGEVSGAVKPSGFM